MAEENSQEVSQAMEKAALKVLTTMIAAGVLALFTVLYNFNARLARIETQLQYINIAQK